MKKKILVVEDQPQMLKNLALMLTLEGYEVFTADNGKSGVETALERLPDLIICDVMMPQLDGHGVIQTLRAEPTTATIPFIFLTARSDRGDVRTGMNSGADDYLVKPVPRLDLLAAVEARLARAEAVEARVQAAATNIGFQPDYSSHEPLMTLGLTNREAEVLLWVAQGKSNGDVAAILGMSEKTVKQHLGSIFAKLGVENRNAAALQAVEVLGKPKG
ncbi:response regulator transcription factor [Luteolibacter luteus]|uniref:Response regulator transcription factor n=1 Tax=Luteolibacter luteus TaxID=2728835 RepID=A0A858RGB3_9BACT|nr:response regulator transcription factor [Luteolibacter luteus]QJE96176.1 response regulator transcription factor [Luteolibacter luteus]